MSVEAKFAITVSEMARMCGLSRARFYQLVGTAFPYPVYSVSTKRPFFDEELQKMCLEVRRRNCGIDGRPILFCSRPAVPKTKSHRGGSASPKKAAKSTDLIIGLAGLGLSGITDQQVERRWSSSIPMGQTVPTSHPVAERVRPSDAVGSLA